MTSPLTPLAPDFIPGPYDVICDRGKNARNHEGNKRYRALIEETASEYAAVNTKYQKSTLVSKIVNKVRKEASRGGGFVKRVDGRWHEVGDALAREKVGQSFRDFLHGLYRSSAKRKHIQRTAVGADIVDTVDELIRSNKVVSNRVAKLSDDLRTRGEDAPEAFMTHLFTEANTDILEELKKDATVLPRFQEAEERRKKLQLKPEERTKKPRVHQAAEKQEKLPPKPAEQQRKLPPESLKPEEEQRKLPPKPEGEKKKTPLQKPEQQLKEPAPYSGVATKKPPPNA